MHTSSRGRRPNVVYCYNIVRQMTQAANLKACTWMWKLRPRLIHVRSLLHSKDVHLKYAWNVLWENDCGVCLDTWLTNWSYTCSMVFYNQKGTSSTLYNSKVVIQYAPYSLWGYVYKYTQNGISESDYDVCFGSYMYIARPKKEG